MAKHKKACEDAKEKSQSAPPAPEWKFTEAYKNEIIDRAYSFVVKKEESEYDCMLCTVVASKDCATECKSFGETRDWANCEAYLEKHKMIQVSLQVSLLYYCHSLVRKPFKMNPGQLQGFYQTVNATQPLGPVLPLNSDAPQAVRLYASVQRKFLSFLFHNPDTYTANGNNQLRQSLLGNSTLLSIACESTRLDKDGKQEDRIRSELSSLTASNPDRRIKNLNDTVGSKDATIADLKATIEQLNL